MLELSTTAYSHASSCLRRYYYADVERLIRRPPDLPLKMRRGIWAHRALQDYHSGTDWLKAMSDFRDYAEANSLDTEQVDSMISEITEMMTGYIAFYEDSPPWRVLAAERPFYLDVGSADLRLRATVDAVVEDHRGLWVVEHKTTENIPPQTWRGCDPQTAIQYLLVERSRQYQDLRGIIFNYLVTEIPKAPRVVGLKEKGGPRFSETCGATTSVAFERGWSELYNLWRGTFGEAMAYEDEWRKKLVADAAFYQRYDVYKPAPLVKSIMADVAAVVAHIRRAEETGVWPRAFHQIMCPRFCTYQQVCSEETLNGKPSQALRESLFVVDDGSREGR